MLLFERLGAYLSFAALVTFTVVGARLSWVLVEQHWLPPLDQAPAAFSPPASTRSLPPLSDWSWVNKYSSISPPARPEPQKEQVVEEKKPEPQPVNLELDRLNVKLLGLMGRASRAIAILNVEGSTRTYISGETIKNNIYLKSVSTDGVVLGEGDSERFLEFGTSSGVISPFNPDANESTPSSVIQPANTAVADTGAQAAPLPENDTRVSASVNDNLPGSVSDDLLQVKALLRSEPVKVANMVRFSQVREGGELQGMRVQPRVNQQLFQSLGFASGDIVTAVNGHSIQDLLTQPALWAGLLSADTYTIELNRDGQQETVTINW